MKAQLRIALVGCGNHMFEFLFHALRHTLACDVVAVCDIDAGRLARFARVYAVPKLYADHNEMLAHEKLDAIIVATPMDVHFIIARDALRKGLHVFVEKTPCRTVEQAEELQALAEASGKSMMVGFNRRFMTAYVMAKEIAERDEFGGIAMYYSQFHGSSYRDETHFKRNHIVHHLDLARFLLGEIQLTHAQRISFSDKRVGFTIAFRSLGGAIGTIQSGALLEEAYPMERLELIGDQRNIVVDNLKSVVYNRPAARRRDRPGPVSLVDGGDALVWNLSHGYYPRYSHHGYESELHHFIECIGAGRAPSPGIGDSSRTMQLLDDLDQLLREK